MQMMMCTPTFGHYLTLRQLSSFLDVPAADLKAVLLAQGVDAAVHDMFLKVFGIHKDTHGTGSGTSACWHLMGCGHLFTLQEADCMHLLSTHPQPTFWKARMWVHDGIEYFFEGCGPSVVLQIGNLNKDMARELQCRNCAGKRQQDWEWMRIESEATAVLRSKPHGELGAKFECVSCESIHIAVPLPSKSHTDGKRWTMDDKAVQLVHSSIADWASRAAAVPRRKTNVMTSSAHESYSPGPVQVAAMATVAVAGVGMEGSGEAAARADDVVREAAQAGGLPLPLSVPPRANNLQGVESFRSRD
ncbi:unnamed protein product [Pylaiella littoralis]